MGLGLQASQLYAAKAASISLLIESVSTPGNELLESRGLSIANMALRPPGNPQLLLRRALSAINTLCYPGRDSLLTPPSLVLPPSSSLSPPFPAGLQTLLDHGRGFSSSGGCIKVTLFPGDGIGPEIADSVKKIFDAVKVQVEWDIHFVGKTVDPKTGSFITWDSMESVRQCGIGLKGPMATPIGKGHKSLNLTLRKELGLYANVQPCLSIPGYKTPYDNVDLVTIRENTEGEYSGLEHQVVKGVVESLKIITHTASKRVAEYAFHYAKLHGRKRVSAIHKANIMKKTDGLFLQCCREVAEKYSDIVYEEVIIDNCCMMLVKNPGLFDVLVMPNLYGNIISDLCAGLIGGLGLTPSGNIGDNGLALMEAVHGTAPDIAGKHLKMTEPADLIHKSILKTIAEGKYLTGDLGGSATCTDYTKALIDNLGK